MSTKYRFNPPPGWPVPAPGWEPPAGWIPDPLWPSPPPNWSFWTTGHQAFAGLPPIAPPAPAKPMAEQLKIVMAEKPEQLKIVMAERRVSREREKAQRKQEHAKRDADELAHYGRKVIHEMFGVRSIRIYDEGFVRVSVPLLGSNARSEQLSPSWRRPTFQRSPVWAAALLL